MYALGSTNPSLSVKTLVGLMEESSAIEARITEVTSAIKRLEEYPLIRISLSRKLKKLRK